MEERILIPLVGLLVVLGLAVILRYRSKGEAKFSIRNWLAFSFRGENVREDKGRSREEANVTYAESTVVADEFVGRDKVTHVHTSTELDEEVPLPYLVLKLFAESGIHQDEIAVVQPQPTGAIQDHSFMFGLALENTVEGSVPAREIDIHVQVSWRGSELHFAPEITADTHRRTTPGWRTSRPKIQQAGKQPLPAVLDFKGTDQDRCAFGHPLKWSRFRGRTSRKVEGHFVLSYQVSSATPHTTSKGELRIALV